MNRSMGASRVTGELIRLTCRAEGGTTPPVSAGGLLAVGCPAHGSSGGNPRLTWGLPYGTIEIRTGSVHELPDGQILTGPYCVDLSIQ